MSSKSGISVSARVFGPGLPSSGSNGRVAANTLGIEVQVAGQRLTPSIDRLQFRETGFGSSGVELAWDGSAGERWSVHVLDPLQAAELIRTPPLAGSPQLMAMHQQQRRVGRWRSVGWTALVTFLLLPVLLLAIFLFNADRIAEWIASKIPVEEEIKFGQSAFEDMKADLKLVPAGPRLEAVATIGARLTRGSKYLYQFHVVDDKTINAFAMPGGIVVVHTGLIEATRRPEELAGVLAHEVQHVEQRHSVEGLVKQLGLVALWSLATGDLGGTMASQAALQLTGLKFSRDAETEADDKGFEALVAANIDPAGMPAFFETMEKENGDLPAGFLSTHPLSRDRKDALSQRLEALGGRTFEPLELAPWPPAP